MNIKVNIIVIVLFMLSINFYDLFYPLTICLFFLSLLTLNNTKYNITLEQFLILLFPILYLLFYPNKEAISIGFFLKQFMYPIAYFVGYILVSRNNLGGHKETKIRGFILLIGLGTCFHGFLNLCINIGTHGLYFSSRMLPDFWTREVWGATGQATLFTFIIGCSFYGIFIRKWATNMFEKGLIIFGVLIALYFNLLMASRAIFVIFILVLITSLIVNSLMTNKQKIENVKVLLVFLLLTIIIISSYNTNFLGAKGFIENSSLFSRLEFLNDNEAHGQGIIGNERGIRQLYALQHFFEHPFGGLNFRSSMGYLHNLWLDVYDMSGIFPFLILVLYFVHIIKKLFYILKYKDIEKDFKVLTFGVYFAFFLHSMVEPIIEGAPWLFILFCFINGMIGNFHSQHKQLRNS
jgi:hypothetical protein